MSRAMGNSLHILIVDDRPDTVLFLSEFLLSHQHRVETSSSGGEALEAIVSRQHTINAYDLLISDVSMPGMDGISLLKDLRRRGISLPVALYTAYGSLHPTLGQDAHQLNCLAVLDKPIELRRVEHLINDVRAMRFGTGRQEKEEPFFGTSRVARPTTEKIRRHDSTPGETLLAPHEGNALERRMATPRPHQMPEIPQAPMPPRNPASLKTSLPFSSENPEPPTRSLPSFRTPVPQDPKHKDTTGRTINPRFRTPLPFLQNNQPLMPPIIPPEVASAPPLRPPGHKTPTPANDEGQVFPTTSFIRRSVDPVIREQTEQIRRHTDHMANQNPSVANKTNSIRK
jgi:CheY-like chemotaxis protein